MNESKMNILFEKTNGSNTPNVANSPLVSIIVPVYNVEDTLYSCLMSVVFQTLNDIEVIIVNDCSPDNSQNIIDEFVGKFPNKVRCVIHEENQGLAYARRTGVRCASAPYVTFVDSDDFVSGNFAEILYNVIEKKQCDMVYYPIYVFSPNSTKGSPLIPPSNPKKSTMIRDVPAAFCGAIYSREFLIENEDVAFRKMRFEDAASTPVLIGRAKKIGTYIDKGLYFYRFGRVGSICESNVSESSICDFLNADNVILENIEKEYLPDCTYRVVERARKAITKKPEAYDYVMYHFRDILNKTEDYKEYYPPYGEKTRQKALSLPDELLIPKIVYINGFVKRELIEFEKYINEAKKAYLFSPQVIVLDDSNCDVQELPEWLKNSSNDDKGLYFAILNIAKTGGVYISPTVRVLTSFNREAFNSAFFVAGPQNRVLSCVFGAEPEAELFNSIIDNIRKHYHADYSLVDTISYTLIEKCGVHLNGDNERDNHGTHILPLKYICSLNDSPENYCFLDYSNYREHDKMLVVPYELIQMAWEKNSGTTKKVTDEKSVKKLKAVYSSNAWKVLSRYYKARDRIKNLFNSK